jgi:rRNA maturation endonuclease Nob1
MLTSGENIDMNSFRFNRSYLREGSEAKQRFKTAFIHLKEALFCPNCEAIFKSDIHVCPTCSSTTSLRLDSVLNRTKNV